VPKDWFVLNGSQDQVCLPPAMHTFLDDMKNVHFIEVPGTGHGFGRPIRWGQPFDEAVDELVKIATRPAKAATPSPPAARVRHFSLRRRRLGDDRRAAGHVSRRARRERRRSELAAVFLERKDARAD